MLPLLNLIYPRLDELILIYGAGKSILKEDSKEREIINIVLNDLDNLKRAEL
jgi:hypothetical protein